MSHVPIEVAAALLLGWSHGIRSRDDRAAGVPVIVSRSWIPGRTRALLYQWTLARPRP